MAPWEKLKIGGGLAYDFSMIYVTFAIYTPWIRFRINKCIIKYNVSLYLENLNWLVSWKTVSYACIWKKGYIDLIDEGWGLISWKNSLLSWWKKSVLIIFLYLKVKERLYWFNHQRHLWDDWQKYKFLEKKAILI